jgi:hypothetical protein
MDWPDVPTCHGAGKMPATGAAFSWRERDGRRHCSYCGSLHPEDLLAALDAGGTLGGSDWKYGWPHKFYVRIPNGRAGQPREAGRATGPGHPPEGTPIVITDSGYDHAKWYNEHLTDAGYSPDAFARLLAALQEHAHIAWGIDPEKGLYFQAPYHGYQKMG